MSDTEPSPGVATGRSRRTAKLSDKKNILAKLKNAKDRGEKLKAESKVDKPVYEYVNELQYQEIVQKRLEDDWVEEDGIGTGYVDDGRDVFDEVEEEERRAKKKLDKNPKAKPKRNRNIGRGQSSFADVDDEESEPEETTTTKGKPAPKKQDIREMFQSKASDAKKKKQSLKDDANLTDLLSEIGDVMDSEPVFSPAFKSKQVASLRTTATPSPLHRASLTNKRVREPDVDDIQAEDFGIGPRQTLLKLSKTSETSQNPFSVNAMETKRARLSSTAVPAESPKIPAPVQESVPERKKVPSLSQGLPSAVAISQELLPKKAVSQEVPKRVEKPVVSVVEEPVQCPWLEEEEASSGLPVVASTDRTATAASYTREGHLRFYWLDAYEDIRVKLGVLFLFGKVFDPVSKEFNSCCLRVNNLQRQMFLLPREIDNSSTERYDVKEVYAELATLLNEKKIVNFKIKPVVKKYAFEPFHIPSEAEYLEIRYSADLPQLPADFSGRTFSCVFGTNTTFLENFILDRQLKGPCWLDVKGATAVSPQFSWCKSDWEVNDCRSVQKLSCEVKLDVPPVVVMAISIKSQHDTKDNQNSIVAVSCVVNNSFQLEGGGVNQKLFKSHFALLSPPRGSVVPFDLSERKLQWGPRYATVHVEPSGERALLSRLLCQWQQVDPDLIVGNDLTSYELDVLLQRLQFHRVPHWHRVGRLRRAAIMPKLSGMSRTNWLERHAFAGRLVCDTRVAAKELIHARSYEMTELVKVLLANNPKEVDNLLTEINFLSETNVLRCFDRSEGVKRLVDAALTTAFTTLRLAHEMQVLPLSLQITGICGNLLSRTLMGGRAERNEYLLLHAFTERGYIPPDKGWMQTKSGKDTAEKDSAAAVKGRRKPAYTGGLVLEPKKGFYDRFILLMDFNSLYPSIIQEFNLCFTTVSRQELLALEKKSKSGQDTEGDPSGTAHLPSLPPRHLEAGILPTEIRKLVESRREVKKLLASGNATPAQRAQWDIRQKALKITANSMYGCLGFGFSRFHAQHLAALVTAKGREILMNTKDMVEGMNFEVIYGDTDSIMVNTNSLDYDQIFKLGKQIKDTVNKQYRLLELDMDGVFRTMLLLKKKQYAALMVNGKNADGTLATKEEMKGLDIVRRDWCRLAVEVGELVVHRILHSTEAQYQQQKEGTGPSLSLVEQIHQYLSDYGQRMRDGKISLESYVITKALAKNPEDYGDAKGQPHVLVALRLNEAGRKGAASDATAAGKGGGGSTSGAQQRMFRAGDTVEYVICNDGTEAPATHRAYALQEVRARQNSEKALTIDVTYYLAHQLHPVVFRLCGPIEGTDAVQIAQCLGLDTASYAAAKRYADRREDGEDWVQGGSDDEEMLGVGAQKFVNCEPILLKCPKCAGQLAPLKEPPFMDKKGNRVVWTCPECKEPVLKPKPSPVNRPGPQHVPPPQPWKSLVVQTTNCIRDKMRAYSLQHLKCDNTVAACDYEVAHVPRIVIVTTAHTEELQQPITKRQLTCQKCGLGRLRPRVSVTALYRHLEFLRFLFTVPDGKTLDQLTTDEKHAFKNLASVAQNYLIKSSYGEVNLSQLFRNVQLFRMKRKMVGA